MYFMPLLWDTSDLLSTLTLFLLDIVLNYQKYWHICSRATCAHINEGSFAFKCLWNNGDVRLITPIKTLKWMPITWTVKLIFICHISIEKIQNKYRYGKFTAVLTTMLLHFVLWLYTVYDKTFMWRVQAQVRHSAIMLSHLFFISQYLKPKCMKCGRRLWMCG